VRGDVLLAAIPFTTLAKVEVSPQFSLAKADVIRTTIYESASRVLIETKTPFWRQQGVNGFALGPDMAEIWDSTFGWSGTHGILQNYVRYDASLALTRKAPEDRIAGTVEMLGKFFPGVSENYIKGFSKCWSEDPWTHGAWGLLGGPRLETGRAAEGRVFFAGEHLSGHASWMQGALSSGLAAMDGIRQFKFEKQRV
jgi:monoamine oxidase